MLNTLQLHVMYVQCELVPLALGGVDVEHRALAAIGSIVVPAVGSPAEATRAFVCRAGVRQVCLVVGVCSHVPARPNAKVGQSACQRGFFTAAHTQSIQREQRGFFTAAHTQSHPVNTKGAECEGGGTCQGCTYFDFTPALLLDFAPAYRPRTQVGSDVTLFPESKPSSE